MEELQIDAYDGTRTLSRTVGFDVEDVNVTPGGNGLYVDVDNAYAWVSREDAERLRDYLIENFPAVEEPAGCPCGCTDESFQDAPLADWERELLEGVPAEPIFKVGDRVQISERYGSAYDGQPGTVVAGGGSDSVFVRFDKDLGVCLTGYGRGTVGAFSSEHVEALPKPEPVNAVDAVVYVTGDSMGWSHEFEPGTEVRIIEDNFDRDEGYDCEPVDGGYRWFVHAADLSDEKPAVPLEKGTVVRILDDGDANGCRHALTVGTLAVARGRLSDDDLNEFVGTWHLSPGPLVQYMPEGSYELVNVDKP